MLTKEQLDEITKIQREMRKRFRSVPDSGQYIEYLGKKFIVYKNVFWPFDDSVPLVENYRINPGDYVLDVCTGSGVIAVFSAYHGAKKVVALDVNPDAVRTAKENAKLHGFDDTIDVRLSDMFDALQEDEQFDVITGNLPFRNQTAIDYVKSSQWDTNLNAHKRFFAEVNNYLKPNGRIYLSQANFGAVEEMKQFADASGFAVKLIGQKTMPKNDPRIFYVFELTRK
jgi:release factor glutamine methyltransferase